MSGFVHEDIHVVDNVEHGDVAVPVIGMAASWIRKCDDVMGPLASQDGKFAEAVDEVLERAGPVLVPADDPCFAALLNLSFCHITDI
jgi:hypothetical protein